MKRVKSHFEGTEPVLEKLLQTIRFRKVEPFIKNGSKLLDLGCGYKGTFLENEHFKISEGTGYDLSVTKQKATGNIKLYAKKLDENLKLPPKHYDIVVSLALMEHLRFPQLIINQAYKTLKKGGLLVLTTPSPKAKNLLEFLAYKIHLVSEKEIRDHKNYYYPNDLLRILIKAGFQKKNIEIQSFSLGFNILGVSKK